MSTYLNVPIILSTKGVFKHGILSKLKKNYSANFLH